MPDDLIIINQRALVQKECAADNNGASSANSGCSGSEQKQERQPERSQHDKAEEGGVGSHRQTLWDLGCDRIMRARGKEEQELPRLSWYSEK